jgi:hypothetical protein
LKPKFGSEAQQNVPENEHQKLTHPIGFKELPSLKMIGSLVCYINSKEPKLKHRRSSGLLTKSLW